ncbi:MAG: hypothetical protein K2G51_03705, partial [Lachnospiraceae bacterium]|nr:hypothetical protein [Lachnospiraceae bacterium]
FVPLRSNLLSKKYPAQSASVIFLQFLIEGAGTSSFISAKNDKAQQSSQLAQLVLPFLHLYTFLHELRQ